MTGNFDNELPDIDITPLERATNQLEKALAAWEKSPSDDLIRDAVIQRFEFTYELCIKIMFRYMRSIAASNDEVDALTFRELIRRASELRLIPSDLSAWIAFRQRAQIPFTPIMKPVPSRCRSHESFLHRSSGTARNAEGENPAMIDPIQLGLSKQDMHIVLRILDANVPDRPVYIFGSRATGKARRRSDIDLAVGGAEPLTLRQRGLLNLDFEESDLPVFVDVLDLNAIEPAFRDRISRDFLLLQRNSVPSEGVPQ